MRTRTIVLGAVGALLLAGVGAAVAQSENVNATASDLREACRPHREGGDRDAFRECRRQAPHHRPLPFESDNGSVTGKWVGFAVDEDGGALLGYASRGPFADAVVFDRVAVDGLSPGETTAHARGGLWIARGPDAAVVAFNAPNAGLFVATPNGTVVTLDPADGVETTLTIDEDGTASGAVVSRDGKTATLRLRGEYELERLEDGTLVATLGEKSGLAFAIDGYPRMTHREATLAKQAFARAYVERDAAGHPPGGADDAPPA